MQCSSLCVAKFSRKFKGLCDQLAAIDHPIDASDKVLWYLWCLGAEFTTLSTTIMSQTPLPTFVDLVSKEISNEISLQPVHSTFTVQKDNNTQSQRDNKKGGGSKKNPSNVSLSLPRVSTSICQLCEKEGHATRRCWT